MSDTTLDELTSLSLWGTADDNAPTRSLGEVIEAIAAALPTASSVGRAKLRHRLGYLSLLVGDARSKSLESFSMMLESAQKANDPRLEALAKCGLSAVYDFVGERHESLKYAREARQIAETLGDQRLLANCLNVEAQFYKENGENLRARELYEQIQVIGEALNDGRLLMSALIGLGRTTDMAHPTAGIAYYQKAIEIAKAHNDQAALAVCYNNLSDWMINTGQYQKAIDLREESLLIAQKHGLRPDVGRALIGQAKAYTLLGDLKKARALLAKGFPTVVSVNDLEGELHSQLNLAYLYVQDGDVPRAVELYRQALEKSLAAPDHACAVFAQRALELLADGEIPKPGIVPDEPAHELDENELESVVGGASSAHYTYPTGDKLWYGGP